MNQMVAQRLLNNLGCQVDVANDGVEAIEILERTNKYDIIFMDCHMPVRKSCTSSLVIIRVSQMIQLQWFV